MYATVYAKSEKTEGNIMDSISFAEKRKKPGNRKTVVSGQKKNLAYREEDVSEASGSRTPNTQIKSLVLYQLS